MTKVFVFLKLNPKPTLKPLNLKLIPKVLKKNIKSDPKSVMSYNRFIAQTSIAEMSVAEISSPKRHLQTVPLRIHNGLANCKLML